MPARLETDEARATAVEIDGGVDVVLGGVWRITSPRPSWSQLIGEQKPARIRARVEDVEKWDTSLLLFLFEVQEWCRVTSAIWDTSHLPERISVLLLQFVRAHEKSAPQDRSANFLTSVGSRTIDTLHRGRTASTFLGEIVIGV